MSDSALDRPSLRQSIRAKRRALSTRQQNLASQNLLRQLERTRLLFRAKHVAVYLANDGEIDPSLVLGALLSRGVKCYLPVLHPFRQNCLLFCEYNWNTRMQVNRYGIAEPDLRYCRTIPVQMLGAVLLPLVAFDSQGNRMGMGGGYYDRTFAFKHRSKHVLPKLIGLAHRCQKVVSLPVESWDIPLDAIITDREAIKIGQDVDL